MSSIDGVGGPSPSQGMGSQQGAAGAAKEKSDDGGGFRSAMSRAAGGAASGVGRAADVVPGGKAIGAAARLLGGSSDGMPGAQDDQMDKMFEMQKQSQMFNLQYLELQNEIQADNRQFSTLSNLMKVRHDTAKSAINNMHA